MSEATLAPTAELPIAELDKTKSTNVREVDTKSEGFQELAASIKTHGVLEPLLVRETPTGPQLIAGFRRLAAARAAGLKDVPVRAVAVGDAELVEVQLLENLQREDLSEIEEARAFEAYLKATGKSQGDLAERIHKSRPYVANRLRLLGLPKSVTDMVDRGQLSASHAEVLLKIPKEAEPVVVAAAKEAAKGGTSVADLDREVTWRAREHLERVEFEKRVKASQFQKCPTCKKSPTYEGSRYDSSGLVGHGEYRVGHKWRLSDGKTDLVLNAEHQARDRKRSAEERGPPAPKRDLTQPATTRASVVPHAIAKRIVEQIGPKGVASVWLATECDQQDDAAGEFVPTHGCVHVHLTAEASKGLPIDAHPLRVRPYAYSTGDQSQVTVREGRWRYGSNGFDEKARKAGIAAFDAWARKSLPSRAASKGTKKVVDPKLLEGNVSEVLDRLMKGKAGSRPADDLELLEELRVLEAKGANRPTVLDRFDDWLDVEEA